MIIQVKKGINSDQIQTLATKSQSIVVNTAEDVLLVTSSKVKDLPEELEPITEKFFVLDTDIQLASKSFREEKRKITLSNVEFGGSSRNSVVITGPCSVESEEQIRNSAELLKELGLKILRAGSFKPRTSPYSFQGMGIKGLQLLDKIREEYGLSIITEVRDASHVDDVIAYADIVQIGAKAMYDHGILRKCGACDKPILLKRGFGSTLQEFVQAAEFILSGGNSQVILCERGIRTFESKTRFTLDLCGVSYLKEFTNLPVILDPSHAMGYAYGVPDLARACMAMDIDGLLIETHPNPKIAKSDASQQLNHKQFIHLYNSLFPIADAIGRKLT